MARTYQACDICGTPGHKAKYCPLAELEKRRDPFGEALRILRARELRRRQRGIVISATPAADQGPLISGARRL